VETVMKWNRQFRVRRDYPNRGEVTLEMTDTRSVLVFNLTQPTYDRRALEDDLVFQKLAPANRTCLLGMYENVAPRIVRSVLANGGEKEVLRLGNTDFIPDSPKVFSALVDVVYSLRNALFHGSITPNEQHNEIYEPAFHIVMRCVRCTL
jgi:hypothetical protein